MSKQKMLAARELINEKRYDEARAILQAVDHPTADKWLAKLDQIAPESIPEPTWSESYYQDEEPDLPDIPTERERPPRKWHWWLQMRCGCYLLIFLLTLSWMIFGVTVGFAVREFVGQIAERVASGELTGDISTQLDQIGIEGSENFTDQAAQIVTELLTQASESTGVNVGINVDGDSIQEVSETAADAGLIATLVSFICSTLPIFLIALFGVLRSLEALRRARRQEQVYGY